MFHETGRLILVLMIITMISALVLSASWQTTQPRIEDNRMARQRENVQAVLPMAVDFVQRKEGDLHIFEGFDEEGDLLGLAVNKVGPGFQGPISIIVGITADSFQITGVRIQDMSETPGLGARITEDWFLQQFTDLQASSTFDDYDAIAGATVSADAVAEILKESLIRIQLLYEEGGN